MLSTGLCDKHGELIHEKDIVDYGGNQRVVTYYPQYMAFSLDHPNRRNAFTWLVMSQDTYKETDGKLISLALEIRSKYVA